MSTYELYRKLQDMVKTIDEYQAVNTKVVGLWEDDVKKILHELVTKSIVLGAAGRPCSKCGGTGRE